MTAREAYLIFQHRISKFEPKDINEALELAKVALEKQIPKKPTLNKTMKIYFCPICERRLNYANILFCSGCGQAIDWKLADCGEVERGK